jgi:hypothetical protein
MGYLSRKPSSNEPSTNLLAENSWGGNEIMDDTALLLNGLAKRCKQCNRVAWIRYLENDLCPDCIITSLNSNLHHRLLEL